MDHTNSAEPSLRSVAAEDYVHVSDSDFREAAPSSDLHADPDLPRSVVGAFAPSFSENDAASSQVDENKVFECLEDRRIGNSSGGGSEERRILPAELAMCVMHLECESSAEGGHCHVYLVGTAHVSQESCSEVQAVISSLKPEVVFLELCSSRIAILTPQNLKVPSINEMIDMWKKKKSNTFGILYSWFLAKVADRLDVFPGAEFRVAYEETVSYGGRVVLGDRPVNITLRRTWGKMSIWHRAKFLYYIFFQTFFLPTPEDLRKMLKDMDDVDMLTLVIQEMSKAFPTIMDTVLHERDMYMSSTLLKVASEHSLVVAVVGKGHLPGIKKYWKQPIDLKHLLQIPRRPAMSKTKFIISGIAVVGASAACSTYLIGKWAAHSQGSFLKSLVDKAPYEVQISLTIATRLESEVTKGLFGEEISPLGDGTVWSQPLVCLAVRRPGGRDPPCSLRTAEARGYQPCSRNKSGRVAQIILRAGLPLRQMSPKPNDIRFSN